MCPLQIINDIEPLSSTLHGVNACFIHHPSNVKNYLIGHKSETDQKKKIHPSYIFLHLSANFWLKIQNTNGRKLLFNFLDICKIDLMAQQMAQRWHTQKSKIG